MKIKDGNILINIEDLASDPSVRAEIVKHAVFSELLLHAVSQVLVHGDVTWPGEDSSWWIGGCGRLRFEAARLELAKMAEPATLAALEEMKALRGKMEKERGEYQSRAWRAEHIVKGHAQKLIESAFDDREVREILDIQNQPA